MILVSRRKWHWSWRPWGFSKT